MPSPTSVPPDAKHDMATGHGPVDPYAVAADADCAGQARSGRGWHLSVLDDHCRRPRGEAGTLVLAGPYDGSGDEWDDGEVAAALCGRERHGCAAAVDLDVGPRDQSRDEHLGTASRKPLVHGGGKRRHACLPKAIGCRAQPSQPPDSGPSFPPDPVAAQAVLIRRRHVARVHPQPDPLPGQLRPDIHLHASLPRGRGRDLLPVRGPVLGNDHHDDGQGVPEPVREMAGVVVEGPAAIGGPEVRASPLGTGSPATGR